MQKLISPSSADILGKVYFILAAFFCTTSNLSTSAPLEDMQGTSAPPTE